MAQRAPRSEPFQQRHPTKERAMPRIKRPALVALAASTLQLGGLAIAPQSGAATLYACVKKKTGASRFVSARTKCRKDETKLSWNTQGVPGRNGASGKNGATGKDGASVGLVDFSDSPFELPLARQVIATLPNVPAASYILIAKTQVEDTNATEPVTVHCYLAGDEAIARLQPTGGSATLSLVSAATIPFASVFTFECNASPTAGVKVAFARLAAIQVQTLAGTTG